MRNYILILALFTNVQIYAQKIKLDGNRLYVDSEYWGYLTEKWTKSGHSTFVFTGVDGKKWMEAQFEIKKSGDSTIGLYKISFYPQYRNVYYKEGMELKNSLCAQLVKSGAFTKTGTYDRGIEKFERNFGTIIQEKTSDKIPNANYQVSIVERDRKAPLFVSNGQIIQDFKQIGTYKETIIARNDSNLIQVFIHDSNDVEIAKAEFEHQNAETAILKIHQNKEILTINLNRGTSEMKIQEIVLQLIYLKKI